MEFAVALSFAFMVVSGNAGDLIEVELPQRRFKLLLDISIFKENELLVVDSHSCLEKTELLH